MCVLHTARLAAVTHRCLSLLPLPSPLLGKIGWAKCLEWWIGHIYIYISIYIHMWIATHPVPGHNSHLKRRIFNIHSTNSTDIFIYVYIFIYPFRKTRNPRNLKNLTPPSPHSSITWCDNSSALRLRPPRHLPISRPTACNQAASGPFIYATIFKETRGRPFGGWKWTYEGGSGGRSPHPDN